MQKIRLLLTTFLLVLGFLNVGGQNLIILVEGELSSNDPNYDVDNKRVILEISDSLGGRADTVTTSSSGSFFDTFSVPRFTSGTVKASITNCRNQYIADTQSIFTDTFKRLDFRLDACPFNTLTLTGSVKKDQPVDKNAMVYLYEADRMGQKNQFKIADSTTVDNKGNYIFTSLNFTNYLLRAKLTSQDPNYGDYLPTYFKRDSGNVSAATWPKGDSISLLSGSVFNTSIHLTDINTPQGPGFISGYVVQGDTGKITRSANPAREVQVTLFNANDEPVGFKETDKSGFYEFPNLALGTYKLRVEIPGKPCQTEEIELTEEDLSGSEINYKVRKDSITRASELLYVQKPRVAELKVFPNPVDDHLGITFPKKRGGSFELTLNTLQGKTLYREVINSRPKPFYKRLDMHDYPEGIYLLRLKTGNSVIYRRIIKQ